ncbi:MAG: nucleotidyltransferase domain-containing protein [Gammaproteobacteria bacterium]|nr:MAG: nucleotidyltransferase domain-containing protein [Gammaproteobacteria bacterium]
MKFGLTAQQYQYIQETVVVPFKNVGATVWIFGSRARGDYHKFSDFDFMVESEEDISSQVSKIQETLENGNFPYKVDIVQSKDLAESYRESFEMDKVEF